MDVGGVGFGARLRAGREAAGLSQQELAERSGLSVRAISNLERGRTQWPYRASLSRLADALGLQETARVEFLAAVPRRQLARPEERAAGDGGGRIPRQLPAAVTRFTGRISELAALTDLLGPASHSTAPALVISAIGGTAGVGKTALAIQWAHQVADRFPDGQLYVNLRGYDPHQPVAAADALAGFLEALGVMGTAIPDEADKRSALYRSRLAGRRMLVLLDNARDGEQVRPLLPGEPGCVAVVTSRDSLSGLVATDGARRLDLDVLPSADAISLLRSLIGPRLSEEPGAAAALSGLCARLPLALRIAAELAAARPAEPVAELAAELEASQLDLLDAGEHRADVRAVFSWSVRQLPADAAEAFALIGLHPGEHLDAYAAAALTGTSTAHARQVLTRLHRASLIQAAESGRYGMHDLLRAYAREQAAAGDADDSCHQALTRLFDYYLAAASAAMDVAFPAEAHQRPDKATEATSLPTLQSEAGARAWLDTERANLTAMAAYCASHGWPRHVIGLATTLPRYLMNGSHLPEAQTIYGHALDAARQSADPAEEAAALDGLGGLDFMKGHFADAARHYEAALQRYRECGSLLGEAESLHNLGVTEQCLHHNRSAAAHFRDAVAAFENAADKFGAARPLSLLARVETEMGLHDDAAGHLQDALPVLHEAKDHSFEATALTLMGELSLRSGQLAQASASFQQALTIFRDIENPDGVAGALCLIGEVSMREDEYQQASSYRREALALFRQTGNQFGEITTLRKLAEALSGDGQDAAARVQLETAVRLAAETGNTYEQASAHRDLAESHHRVHDGDQTRYHWQQALALCAQLDAPEAEHVRARFSALAVEAPR